MKLQINPATGEELSSMPVLEESQMDSEIRLAKAAQPAWRKLGYAGRAEVLRRVAQELRADKDNLARRMATEMGKPIREGGPEVEKAAWCSEHYAENASAYLADEQIVSDAGKSYVTYQPLGTLLGILPWNAPLWLAFRYLAPALMAGNTCVIKHDPQVQRSALGILEAFSRAGAPQNIVVNLSIPNDLVKDAIAHPDIAAISFTGSSRTGALVASTAAAHIKPAVLELGGSDPCIVMADADLEKAADVAVLSRIINAGQSCIAAKRILVEKPVYETFIEMVKSRLEKRKVGNPLEEETQVGPIAVLSSVDNFEEALEKANDTPYGLGASVWTENVACQDRAIDELEAGQVAVNGIVKTDPRLPSGGIKRSGYGRELGRHGIKEFVNVKQVWMR